MTLLTYSVIDAAEDYSKSGDYKKAIFTGTESMTKRWNKSKCMREMWKFIEIWVIYQLLFSMASSNPLVGAALAVGSSMSKGKSIQSAVVDWYLIKSHS